MKKDNTVLVLGGDGYLGWSVGLALGKRTDANVVLVDSMVKRDWEREVDARSLVPFPEPKARISSYKKAYGRSNISFEKVDLLDHAAVVRLLKKHRPAVIINAAQQPSAPFSMMNAKNAAVTFSNNIVGHLNVIWALAEVDASVTYIKLGSAGCYMGIDTDYLPLEKTDFAFEYRGKERHILQSWFPMNATDFYHQSKITDFLISDLAASVWKLKMVTVQQATIFGAAIDENGSPEHHALGTRFNYDAVFGTVMNRFACQSAIGYPLTIYGDGKQTTGLMSLRDTVDTFVRLAHSDVPAGEHKVLHDFTFRMSIGDIAESLSKLSGSSKVQYLENPRKEPGGALTKEIEVHPVLEETRKNAGPKFEKDLSDFLDFTARYKDNIVTSVILPRVTWEKRGKKDSPVPLKEGRFAKDKAAPAKKAEARAYRT